MSHVRFFYVCAALFLIGVGFLAYSISKKLENYKPYTIMCIDGVEYLIFDSGSVVPHGDELGFQTPCPPHE